MCLYIYIYSYVERKNIILKIYLYIFKFDFRSRSLYWLFFLSFCINKYMFAYKIFEYITNLKNINQKIYK